jgi:ribosomal protein L11 methyltransferase
MYLWRKHANLKWVRERGEDFAARFGAAAAIIEQPGRARAVIEVSCRTKAEAVAIRREFGGTIQKLPRDWLQRFSAKTRAIPLRIGARLVVERSPVRQRKNSPAIVIPAGAAFGTGEHATTAMCLRMLERVTRKLASGWTMLDAGTGSGILAIAGSRLGAGETLAIDNDPIAVRIARRNAHANHARNIRFETGDVLKQKLRGRFDVISGNLFSEILIAALPKWSRHLARGGSLIFSGVLRAEEKALLTALDENRFVPAEVRRRGKWIAVLARRGGKGLTETAAQSIFCDPFAASIFLHPRG